MARTGRTLGTLAAALGLAAVVLALPAWRRFGPAGLEALAYGALSCFVPGLILSLAARRFRGTNRMLQLLLTGTALRVGFVAAAAVVVAELRPPLCEPEFFLGLTAFYLVALAVETRELLRADALERQAAADCGSASSCHPGAN